MNDEYLKTIRTWDDPILKVVCEPVGNEDIMPTANLMAKICKMGKGVGLAAPQIGVAKRIIYIAPSKETGLTVGLWMINPVITVHGGTSIQREGCLSYPNIRKPIERYDLVDAQFETLKRKKVEQTFYKFPARVIQHENDHLNGICKVGEGEVKPQPYKHSNVSIGTLLLATIPFIR